MRSSLGLDPGAGKKTAATSGCAALVVGGGGGRNLRQDRAGTMVGRRLAAGGVAARKVGNGESADD